MEKNHHKSQKTYKKHQQKQQQPILQKSKETESEPEPEPLHLLEDGWFFGNSLHRTPKIIRCYSEPPPSSRTTDMMLAGTNNNNNNNSSSKMSGDLQRRPSLPPNIWREEEYDWKENDDEDDEPRMGDLIRQATMPRKELSRLPSLPPVMSKPEEESTMMVNTGQQKMSKLTRRASLDPSLLLPPCPKHTCSSAKSSPKSTSRHHHNHRGKSHHHNQDPRNINSTGTTPPHTPQTKSSPILRRSMSLLTLSDQEVRGFRDLGFSFDKDELVNGISCLEIKESEEEEENEDEEDENTQNNNHPSMSQAWTGVTRGSSGWSNWTNTPTIPKWTVDSSKGSLSLSSADDMKAQIKFWARAVASNVR